MFAFFFDKMKITCYSCKKDIKARVGMCVWMCVVRCGGEREDG